MPLCKQSNKIITLFHDHWDRNSPSFTIPPIIFTKNYATYPVDLFNEQFLMIGCQIHFLRDFFAWISYLIMQTSGHDHKYNKQIRASICNSIVLIGIRLMKGHCYNRHDVASCMSQSKATCKTHASSSMFSYLGCQIHENNCMLVYYNNKPHKVWSVSKAEYLKSQLTLTGMLLMHPQSNLCCSCTLWHLC